MAANGIGRLELISGMTNGRKYLIGWKIKFCLGDVFCFLFSDDNAPCHGPVQYPGLNPNENL